MKKMVMYILISLVSLISFGKKVDSTLALDKLSFEYINQYREFHGVSKVFWSNELYKTSVSHTDKLIKTNKDNPSKHTLYHSGISYENCMLVGVGAPTKGVNGKSKFFEFTLKYFNLTLQFSLEPHNK